MFYPVYVYKEEGSAYGAVFPDFPGCFTAADHLSELGAAAQQAVEAHFGNDQDPIPAPSTPEAWAHDPDYQGGFWLLVDVDLAKVRDHVVRLNITLPASLVPQIDAYAKARGMSRSAFLAKAAVQELAAAY